MPKKQALLWLKISGIAMVAVAVFFVFRSPNKRIEVPPEFLEAKTASVAIAEEITGLSSQAAANLEAISREDKAGNYEKAVDLVIVEIKRNNEIREKCIGLLSELQKMIASLGEIKSVQAQGAGLQAISAEMTLVNQLISYNGGLQNLLEQLRLKFLSNSPKDFDAATSSILQQVNDQVSQINSQNRKAQTLIREFNKYFED
ncbi:MAG: hypothetical protein M1586_02810 [Patescibacteria group bacterium]|nr:hypothetical protein [Patescibacteria group bacterium]MCL5262199.1 hypothetical protein [Patescibacteria group bacterium]